MEEEFDTKQSLKEKIAVFIADNKRLVIIIAIAVVAVTAIVIVIAVLMQNSKPAPTNIPEVALEIRSPEIIINPSQITPVPGTSDYSATIEVNSFNIDSKGVVVEIKYDPRIVTNVKLVPSSDADLTLGGAVEILSESSESGLVSIAIRNSQDEIPAGRISGRIAILYFTLLADETTRIELTRASDFMTKDAAPTNPTLGNLLIEVNNSSLAPDAQDRLLQQQQLLQ